jgi:hypothetical protein
VETVQKTGNQRRDTHQFAGMFFVELSFFSILVSLGMPGVGWVMSAFALVACSFSSPFVGRQYLAVSFATSLVHLFSVGPLSGFQLGADRSVAFLILLVALPLAVAVVSLSAPVWAAGQARLSSSR